MRYTTRTCPFEDLDLLATSSPFPVYRRSHQRITAMNREADRELLEGLRAARLSAVLRAGRNRLADHVPERGGGYYFDAGCSQMVVDGRIGLIQYDDIERFGHEGAVMQDGSVKQPT